MHHLITNRKSFTKSLKYTQYQKNCKEFLLYNIKVFFFFFHTIIPVRMLKFCMQTFKKLNRKHIFHFMLKTYALLLFLVCNIRSLEKEK